LLIEARSDPSMKDDNSPPPDPGNSPNAFERDKPGTAERARAEAAIEQLRKRGGIFVEAVRATRMPMALTDPNLPGNPIVFANAAFLKLSGYRMEEVLGQEPHFMNGPSTDRRDAARFTEAIRSDQDDIIETVQYRKNGTRFVATVLISAFKDDEGTVVNHFMSWLDVTRRVEAEDEISGLREAQAALREELRNTKILNDLGSRFVSDDNVQTIYDDILTAAIEITGAKAGTVQVLDPETHELVILASRGFSKPTLDYFQRVKAGSDTSCGIALRSGERAYLNFDPASSEKSARLHVKDGVLSAQSSPLVTRSGDSIGMVSTHWGEPDHRLSERQLRFLDLLARQAADLIEQRRSIDALQKSERHAQTLLGELQHRVRNTLGVIRSIAKRTAENSRNVADMLAHFQGRLDAFSRVQAALTRNPEGRIGLASIVEDELLAHAAREGDQVRISGPDILLDPKTAERLTLAIHELTTNAVKHGALATRSGRIDISWEKARSSAGFELVFRWLESGAEHDGGSPGHEGFGMELLRRSLPYDVGGATKLDLTPGGLEFEFRMPLEPNRRNKS
jgi:PAS domain S-box-containing protein